MRPEAAPVHSWMVVTAMCENAPDDYCEDDTVANSLPVSRWSRMDSAKY